ncbi:ankyrin repeat-containing domain protein [Xylariomycetidae sp. FL2044]|nr:ankyrin repeat-containing domain protein [Xylariomycetidae sp. FL2044]
MAGFSLLPDELIVLIVQQCDIESQAALTATSRRLHCVAGHILYETYADRALVWATREGKVSTLKHVLAIRTPTGKPRADLQLAVNIIVSREREDSLKKGSDTESLRLLITNGLNLHSHWMPCSYQDCCVWEDLDWGSWPWTPSHGSVKSVTTLEKAIYNKKENLANLLIDSGAVFISPYIDNTPDHFTRRGLVTPISDNAMHSAASRGLVSTTRKLVQERRVPVDILDANGRTAFQCAFQQNQIDTAKVLAQLGADVELSKERGPPLLFSRIWYRDWEQAIQLIHMGASVTTQYDSVTPLILACCEEDLEGMDMKELHYWRELVSLLVAKGADINQPEAFTEQTPLHLISHWEPIRGDYAMEVLLELGADPKRRDSRGNTALISCCQEMLEKRTHYNKIQLLVNTGEGINERNNSGCSALSISCLGRSPEDLNVSLRLLKAGADPNAVLPDPKRPGMWRSVLSWTQDEMLYQEIKRAGGWFHPHELARLHVDKWLAPRGPDAWRVPFIPNDEALEIQGEMLQLANTLPGNLTYQIFVRFHGLERFA